MLQTSYIEKHEEEFAKDFVTQTLGFEPLRPCGDQILIKIYVREEDVHKYVDEKTGKEHMLYLPDSMSAHDHHRSNVGLVLSMGPACFKGERFKDEPEPRCKVGDWILVPAADGYKFIYQHFNEKTNKKDFYAFKIIFDDWVKAVLPNPECINPWNIENFSNFK